MGAVLVHQEEVIAAAHNRVEETSDPTLHAEMICLQRAAACRDNWRLLDSSLYVTLEPCPMCAGAILLSRVGRVIYGTSSPLLGEGSARADDLMPLLDNLVQNKETIQLFS